MRVSAPSNAILARLPHSAVSTIAVAQVSMSITSTLRYNKALWEVVQRENGEGIIWARSAWAGSQRYALHWGGDAATTNTGMMGDLRGGLSFGLSGFSFWSHDIGGFVTASPEDIYRRWLPFGFLSSHSRAHGAPPTEPWLISKDFTDAFRQAAELKYRLMPYVYAQAKDCSTASPNGSCFVHRVP